MNASATDRRRLRLTCSGVRDRPGSFWSATDQSGRRRFDEPHAEEPEEVDDRISKKALCRAIAGGVPAPPKDECAPQKLCPEEKRRDAVERTGLAEEIRQPGNRSEESRVDEDLPPG